MDQHRGIIRAVGSMSVMTALSRVAGYVRDSLQAALLGAADASDAFVIAFRIPNMLRRLVGEGAMTSSFVPTFTSYMRRGDSAAMWRFAASVMYVLTIALTVVVVLGVIFSPLLVRALAWGFTVSPDKMALTISLSRWMFPYIFFIALAALASAILNSFDVFALPAFTPLLLNLSIITCALTLSHRFANPARAFAVGVVLGGILQLAIQVPALLRRGLTLRPPRPFDRAGVSEVARLMLPRVFGVGITQVNLVVDTQFAASLRAGSVSFLYYAIRITELTLGLFAISLSTVILPALSRAAADGDRERILKTLGTAARLLVFITAPATLGLILLREPIIQTLFERGRFGIEDTRFTAGALACYGAGLLPFAATTVLATAFYAHRDTVTPVRVGMATFVLHLGLNFALREPLAHIGIALSTSVSAFVDALLLTVILRRRHGDFLDHGARTSFRHSCLAAAVMGTALYAARASFDFAALPGTSVRAAVLGGLVGGGAALYLATAALIGSEEVRHIAAALRRHGRPS